MQKQNAEILESLARDESIPSSPLMNIVREAVTMGLTKAENNTGDNEIDLKEISNDRKRALRLLSKVSNSSNENMIELVKAIIIKFEATLGLATSDIRLNRKMAEAYRLMFQKTKEGREAAEILKTHFTSPKAAAEYVKNNW